MTMTIFFPEENRPVVLYGSGFSKDRPSQFLPCSSLSQLKKTDPWQTHTKSSSVHAFLQHRNDEGLAVPREQERLTALGTKRKEKQLVTAV